MRTRRHARRMRGSAGVVLLVVGLALVVLGSGGTYAAYRYDAATVHRILPGVTVAGVHVGGMTGEEALRAVERASSLYLDRGIEVQARGRSWHVTPAELGTVADARAKVEQALAVTDEFAWPRRVFNRLFDREVDRSYDLEYTHDPKGMKRFLKAMARAVEVNPANAEVTFEDGELRITKPRKGYRLAMARSRRALLQSLDGQGNGTVEAVVKTLKPKVGVEDLGHTIVVRLSELKLYLYDGVKLVKTYPVAAGQSAYPTPTGNWTVVGKRENPTWVNPDPEGWGKDLPKVVGPGPGNPLGTHALYLDAPGIRIHGTYSSSSIGTYASHGCIRMYLGDVQELFSTVDVGTPAYVYW